MWLIKAVFFFFLAIIIAIFMGVAVKWSGGKKDEIYQNGIIEEKDDQRRIEEKGEEVILLIEKVNRKISNLKEKGINVHNFSEEDPDMLKNLLNRYS